MTNRLLVLVESNTSGSGRQFCAAARALNLRPVLLARDPGRYSYVADDDVECVVTDTADVSSVLAVCEALRGETVGVTSSSEYFVGVAAEAARLLGLPHPDPAAVEACRNKYVQRTILAACGLAPTAYTLAHTADDAVAAADAICYPVVVKPLCGSGSVGVRRCNTASETAAAATAVLALGDFAPPRSGTRAVLIEEYVAGDEYSVETFDGQVIGVTAKHLGNEPCFVEIGHDFPAALDDESRSALTAAATAAVCSLGLAWGCAHVELRMSQCGPRIIEVNPRLAGGMIPAVIKEASGVDSISLAVAKAAGMPVMLKSIRNHAAAIRFVVASEDGILARFAGIRAAAKSAGVVEVGLLKQPGQHVVRRGSFEDRIAYVIAQAEDTCAAARAADKAVALVGWEWAA
jgi:S-sulfo-L-cysteine synthase (3-phospho-L-serine-dependent)